MRMCTLLRPLALPVGTRLLPFQVQLLRWVQGAAVAPSWFAVASRALAAAGPEATQATLSALLQCCKHHVPNAAHGACTNSAGALLLDFGQHENCSAEHLQRLLAVADELPRGMKRIAVTKKLGGLLASRV